MSCGGSKEGRVSVPKGKKNSFIEKGALRLTLRGSYAVRDGLIQLVSLTQRLLCSECSANVE